MAPIGFAAILHPADDKPGNCEMPSTHVPIRHQSISQLTFDFLQTAIFDCRLEADVIYNEASIARELGISTSPVRDAFAKLAGKGFIEILPRRGVKLTELGQKPFSGLFELRQSIERAVLLKVVPNLEDGQIDHLSSLLNVYMTQADFDAGLNSDSAIHRYLTSLTCHQNMVNALMGIEDQWNWVSRRVLLAKNSLEAWKVEHFRIHACLKRRDAEGAWQAMKTHLHHHVLGP